MIIVFNAQYILIETQKNNICIAMAMQKTETNGLDLSPILDIFQQKPTTPVRFIRGWPGS